MGSGCASTPSTSSGPTRCLAAPGRIDCPAGCGTRTASPLAWPPASTSDRSCCQFAGRQKILKSLKWGFTKYPREDYVKMRKNGELSADGNIVKVRNRHGLLETSALYSAGQE